MADVVWKGVYAQVFGTPQLLLGIPLVFIWEHFEHSRPPWTDILKGKYAFKKVKFYSKRPK